MRILLASQASPPTLQIVRERAVIDNPKPVGFGERLYVNNWIIHNQTVSTKVRSTRLKTLSETPSSKSVSTTLMTIPA